MIEVTDEMVQAFTDVAMVDDHGARLGLVAALAIVERDWNMQPREAPAVRWRCNRVERCFREDGHGGRHGFAGAVQL